MVKLAKVLVNPQHLVVGVANLNFRMILGVVLARFRPVPESVARKLIIRVHLEKKVFGQFTLTNLPVLPDCTVQILVLLRPCIKALPVLLQDEVVIVVIESLDGPLLPLFIHLEVIQIFSVRNIIGWHRDKRLRILVEQYF